MINEVISMFRLSAEVYHNAVICGDWQIRESRTGQTCFHMPTQGECFLDVPDQEKRKLGEGDLVIFPREVPHKMYPVEASTGKQQHLPYLGCKETDVGMLCGRLHFQHRGFNYFLDALPEVFVIKKASANWLTPLLQLIIQECYQSESTNNSILDRVSELLFILAIRHYVEQNPEQTGVLALYTHRKLSKALHVIHDKPQESWPVLLLAEHAGMSRTSFANAFKKVSGWTPAQYLTWWRMQVAWSELSDNNNIAETAYKVGYKSESSFSRAFHKEFGIRAGQVRKNNYKPQKQLN